MQSWLHLGVIQSSNQQVYNIKCGSDIFGSKKVKKILTTRKCSSGYTWKQQSQETNNNLTTKSVVLIMSGSNKVIKTNNLTTKGVVLIMSGSNKVMKPTTIINNTKCDSGYVWNSGSNKARRLVMCNEKWLISLLSTFSVTLKW